VACRPVTLRLQSGFLMWLLQIVHVVRLKDGVEGAFVLVRVKASNFLHIFIVSRRSCALFQNVASAEGNH